jgi:Domain of unknown function (DUF4214)
VVAWLLAAPLLVAAVLAVGTRPAGAANVVPAQWIAKAYTEGLGRAPDPTGWANMIAFFQSNGCSASTLAQKGEQIYTSSEFNGLAYDNAARLLALYRGALNREPDSSGYNFYLNRLNSGTSWTTVVDDIFTSSEFTGDAATFCTQGPYYFGGGAAITIPLGQGCSGQFCFTGGTQSQLQNMLDSAPPGTTVMLAQQVVVSITSTVTVGPPTRTVGLNIPAGVTLTTAGQPGPNKYAEMGRLVRGQTFGDSGTSTAGAVAVVEVESGAKLTNVWVDGQRKDRTDSQSATTNVETAGGSGTTVSNDRLSDATGFTNLHALGTAEGASCSSTTITGNLSTQYATDHVDTGDWSDGLSVACENATVTGNTVIDATDVSIVLFRACPADQKSTVANNTILNAGNSAFGGIVADPLTHPTCGPNFAGSSVNGNTLTTGPTASYGIGLSLGTAAWFSNPNIGTGASFTNNSLTGNVTEGLTVSGMLNVTATGNTLNLTLGQHTKSCPEGEIVVDPQRGSGTIQQPITNATVLSCI